MTVKFDTSRLTAEVLADLERQIQQLPEVDNHNFEEFYDLALRAIAAGGDLHLLSKGIMSMKIQGMTRKRAAQISTRLWFRASGRSDIERQPSVGITRNKWMYANAPCMSDPKHPTTEDLIRDAAHRAANGKSFRIDEGLLINGVRVWPGDEEGCRCTSRAQIDGFDDD